MAYKWCSAVHHLQKKQSCRKLELVNWQLTLSSDRAISREELARHCTRRIRGTSKILKWLEELFFSLDGKTDSFGVQLFCYSYFGVWEAEKHHVRCLQDPNGVMMYVKMVKLTKGNIILPVYWSARGTTLPKSFHLHLNNLIPGKCITKKLIIIFSQTILNHAQPFRF